MSERQTQPLGLKQQLTGDRAPGFRTTRVPHRKVLPAPVGTPASNKATGVNVSKEEDTKAAAAGLTGEAKFKQELLKMQVDNREAQGKKAINGLAKEDLADIAGSAKKDKVMQMHKDIAPLFTTMWDQIVKAHAARGNPKATDSIGVASAYRDAKEDAAAWEGSFAKAIKKTKDDREATKDPYGAESLQIIYQFINGKKAPPGFSGHTHGIAVDLTTTEDNKTWVVNSDYDHQVGWQKTWLYGWLCENAAKHKFYQLKTETWHWEYHADGAPSPCWGGKLSVKERPVKKPAPAAK